MRGGGVKIVLTYLTHSRGHKMERFFSTFEKVCRIQFQLGVRPTPTGGDHPLPPDPKLQDG